MYFIMHFRSVLLDEYILTLINSLLKSISNLINLIYYVISTPDILLLIPKPLYTSLAVCLYVRESVVLKSKNEICRYFSQQIR